VTVKARLEKRPVPAAIMSMEAGDSGEVLTGPDKPRFFDPRNVLWSQPVRRPDGAVPGLTASYPLDLALSTDGTVIDVRFVDPATPDAARRRERALAWRFTPATYDGEPKKTRIVTDPSGFQIAPPLGGGAPMEIGADGVTAPNVAVRVELPAGTKAPQKPPHIRLTIDPSGAVADAALQSSCGDTVLDAAALDAARKLVFEPATKVRLDRKEPDPIAVYLDVEARFVEAPAPSK
jgi:TonB family protein